METLYAYLAGAIDTHGRISISRDRGYRRGDRGWPPSRERRSPVGERRVEARARPLSQQIARHPLRDFTSFQIARGQVFTVETGHHDHAALDVKQAFAN